MEDANSMTYSTLEKGYDFFISDKWRKKYHFKIFSFPIPCGWLSEAIEVLKDNPVFERRMFQIISDFDADIEKSELQLKARIKRGINKRYLISNPDGRLAIGEDGKVAGRILWDQEVPGSEFQRYFEMDGKKITAEEFIELFSSFEGWNFRLQMLDPSEDLDG
ncbi:DUF7713 domain-containing protein [Geofilum rubicundum]|uniref:Uncharacterized protein n=1 Tax=Geofilum rubicundum JCM 15548 TaxID=1236989 RepID=A0A0E9M2B9_9BACT|nr:hypothetical protein [Geofilum rubicundum]GAO31275.1 hypothetical protein JCM15548_13623 [Geofilum rubicundum JCM 15548]